MKTYGLWVGLLLLFTSWIAPTAHAEDPPSPFQDLPYAVALKQAAAGNKIVLIDFFTTWCGPCKLLDAITWHDPAVVALLRAKTVALRIDAEKQADLAKQFTIRAYPTLILIKPDGTVLDTLVGYQDAPTFIGNFNSSLAGKTSLTRAQDAVAAANGGLDAHAQVEARYRLGKELDRHGQDAEALAEYLWCFDQGMKQVPSYMGVRVSFLLMDIGNLGKHYPPALDALKTRRDAARTILSTSPADASAQSDFAGLNHYLGDDALTLAYFDQLPPNAPGRSNMIGYFAFDFLLEKQRYADAIQAISYARFNQIHHPATSDSALPPAAMAALKDDTIRSGAKELEALAGAGHLDEAKTLLATLLNLDKSPATQAILRQHLQRAGHPELLAP